MQDFLAAYDPWQIVIFLAALCAAIWSGGKFLEWAAGKIRHWYDKGYKSKADKKRLEDEIGSTKDYAAQFLSEKKRVDEGFAELREVDRKIMGSLAEIRRLMDEQKRVDDERYADGVRSDILRFNLELIRGIRHTREDFIEALSKIDKYERYCESHKDYRNNRAVSATANIKRTYDERLQKRDFV